MEDHHTPTHPVFWLHHRDTFWINRPPAELTMKSTASSANQPPLEEVLSVCGPALRGLQ